MPRQNRPVVRDGRAQTPGKRTDRSYLRPSAPPTASESEPTGEPDAVAEAIASGTAPPAKLPSSVRALQQQGVRKRRDVDLEALAVSDTKRAIHELRRIAVLATMVIATLIVLAIVMR